MSGAERWVHLAGARKNKGRITAAMLHFRFGVRAFSRFALTLIAVGLSRHWPDDVWPAKPTNCSGAFAGPSSADFDARLAGQNKSTPARRERSRKGKGKGKGWEWQARFARLPLPING